LWGGGRRVGGVGGGGWGYPPHDLGRRAGPLKSRKENVKKRLRDYKGRLKKKTRERAKWKRTHKKREGGKKRVGGATGHVICN